MNALAQLLVFRLAGQRYAAALERVERVVSAVEITPLPKAPAIVLGVIDFAGKIIPVLSLRQRLGLKESELSPADHFLIVNTGTRIVALVIDDAIGVIEYANREIIETVGIVPQTGQGDGLLKLPDGLVLMHDLEKLLSLQETLVMEEAMEVPRGT